MSNNTELREHDWPTDSHPVDVRWKIWSHLGWFVFDAAPWGDIPMVGASKLHSAGIPNSCDVTGAVVAPVEQTAPLGLQDEPEWARWLFNVQRDDGTTPRWAWPEFSSDVCRCGDLRWQHTAYDAGPDDTDTPCRQRKWSPSRGADVRCGCKKFELLVYDVDDGEAGVDEGDPTCD